MTYELAKKLRNAGFKQKGLGFLMNGNVYAPGFSELTSDLYVPTLSELIEACGDEFDSLEKRGGVYFAFGSSKDSAMMKMDPYRGSGATPEEAVGVLWLVLNEKEA